METQIANLCLDCQTHYQKLSDSLKTAKNDSVSSVAIHNELGRFRIWVNSIGAMLPGKHSLDFKLKDVKFLYKSIVRLLEDIREILMEG
jgi:hypothetical protein